MFNWHVYTTEKLTLKLHCTVQSSKTRETVNFTVFIVPGFIIVYEQYSTYLDRYEVAML